jgi:hypothetical protein
MATLVGEGEAAVVGVVPWVELGFGRIGDSPARAQVDFESAAFRHPHLLRIWN